MSSANYDEFEDYDNPYNEPTPSRSPRFSRAQKGGIGAAVGFFMLLIVLLIVYVGITYGVYDGDWGWITTLAKATCEEKTCVGGVFNKDKCACECFDGYIGELCDTRRGSKAPPIVRQCPDIPCENGRVDPLTCKCICDQGFEGPPCKPCTNSCVNGSRATSGCACYCDIGWYGSDCSSRSQNDAVVCSEGSNCSFGTLNPSTCECECWKYYSPDGNGGCKRDCSQTPCVNGSYSADGMCDCECDPGFMGRACDQVLTPDCPTTVCYNGTVNDKCECVCDPGYEGRSCRMKSFDGEWYTHANKCFNEPGTVWTGYQCMTIGTAEDACPMGPTEPYQCVNRQGFNYVHPVNSNNPWECALGDERNGGFMGDPADYSLGGRCMTAQSTQACEQLIDDMECNRQPSVLFENM